MKLLCVLFLFIPFFSLADNENVPALLAGRGIGQTPLMLDLQELCDTVGGRITGSTAGDAAIEWGVGKFKDAGVQNVTTESFPVQLLWLPQSAEVSMTAPRNVEIRAVSAAFSPSTPEAGIEQSLINAGHGTPEEFQKLGSKAQGKIALVLNNEMKTLGDLFEEYLNNKSILEAAHKAGVSGILLQSSRPGGLLYRHVLSFGTSYSPMPVALISREQGAMLQRLTQKDAVRVRMNLKNKTGPAYESKNVVAEIRGSEKPNEIVLLGAHLDSWELGTGAQDNGVNVVTVIDVARAIMQLHLVPRRTIRFVLFMGEEEGMWGSRGYVDRHAAEMDNHVAAVIFDIGSGKTTGFYLNGREELRAPINQILRPLTALQVFDHVPDGVDGTDNFDFLLSGVPNLVANQIADPYLPDYHAESDVFEKVDQREASINDAIAAVLIWGLAESPERLGPRQSRAEVEKLLRDTKLDEQMKAFDQWQDWEQGKRGASKN